MGTPRIVIFGCGYVGGAVAREALRRGAEVTALTRNPERAAELRRSGVRVVEAELGEQRWHAAVGGGFEWGLNCVSGGGGGLEAYRRSYVDGMESIVRWTADHGPVGTLVYTSSTSVYAADGGVIVDEAAPAGEGGERAQVLRLAEQRLEAAAGAAGRWFVLRLAGIYGPGRHYLLDQIRTGEVAGLGGHRLNLIHRDDIVSAIWACFTAPDACRNRIFNLADDAPARKEDVVNWLAQKLGCPSPVFTGQPAGRRSSVTPDRLISNAQIKAALGWRPRHPDFRAGYGALLSD